MAKAMGDAHPPVDRPIGIETPRASIIKAKRPKSGRDLPNWILYLCLRVLAQQYWVFPAQRLYKFRKSANKRAVLLNGGNVRQVLQEMAHDGLDYSRRRPSYGFDHPIGFRANMLVNLRPFELQIADSIHRPVKRQPINRSNFIAALNIALSKSDGAGVLALSHDNYRTNVGGLQLCLLIEEAAFLNRNTAYIHLYPARSVSALAPQEMLSNFEFGVTLNGEWFGHILARDLLEDITAVTGKGGRFFMAVHSLLGHSTEITARLYHACAPERAFFWLHDYFSLCPAYTLMRNTVSPCGAPPPESAGCGICHVGRHRTLHLNRLRALFSEIPFTVVAPSRSALDLWQRASDLAFSVALIQEHCELHQTSEPGVGQPPSVGLNAQDGSRLNIGYLGLPMLHKGWSVFAEVARELVGHPDFSFHHLGKAKSREAPPGIAFTPVTISSGDWAAMSAAVRSKRIDIAMLCSLWPETYNFTAFEALTGGAFILTLESSGNIAAMVRDHNCGMVFGDEKALRKAFTDGSLVREVRDRLRRNRPRYELVHRNMTADLVA
ncbi:MULTISPECIES: hypothetical protein [Rhodomicrobium]|uniref:hypothetical protein n=1 Tax=Rhodomicrobium TaxID=1068 RepID=UPI000F737EA6|nr:MULTISPECIES: hypothetical protein [Rhodomicrobium]